MAQSQMDAGIQLYKAGKFAQAVPVFKAVVAANPKSPNALYYYALSMHQSKDLAGAAAAYKQLMRSFPRSPAADLAEQALQMISKGGVVQERSQEQSADYDSLPQDALVYFKKVENEGMYVTARVNNRPIDMIFDTGAEGCAFGKNHLRELGLRLPEGQPIGAAVGVGNSGQIPIWVMKVDLQVGTILRKDVQIFVQETLPSPPLLGQTFFRDFHYTVDNGASSIRFAKKGRAVAKTSTTARSYPSSSGDPFAVPFVRDGNIILVAAEVNGKPCRMIFDTGASGTVFSYGLLKRLGIAIPEDAEEEIHQGIAGETEGASFEIPRLKLGPLEKRNFRISAVKSLGVDAPLLGQTFFGEWQYTIDDAAQVIRFVRR